MSYYTQMPGESLRSLYDRLRSQNAQHEPNGFVSLLREDYSFSDQMPVVVFFAVYEILRQTEAEANARQQFPAPTPESLLTGDPDKVWPPTLPEQPNKPMTR